jgi:glycosyltransferase involved in cell wall biosynthesis
MSRSQSDAEFFNISKNDTDVLSDLIIVDERLRERDEERDRARLEKKNTDSDVHDSDTSVEDPLVPFEEVRSSKRVLPITTTRDSVRLLVCSKRIAMLNEGSELQYKLLEWGRIFSEIHVILLTVRRRSEPLTLRLSDNVWIHTTSSSGILRSMYDAYHLAEHELMFGDGFRADLIIAEDPCESGVVGHLLSRSYERPFQIHLFDDVFDPSFTKEEEHNELRLMVAKYLLKRAQTVRTASEHLKNRVIEQYPALASRTESFPVYHDLSVWRNATVDVNLKERYPQFSFIMLHVTSMRSTSHTREVIDGALPLLRLYPTVGLIVVGSGPYRLALERHVSELGIAGKVLFEPMSDSLISHMKTAQVLIHTSEESEEDTLFLQAASVGLPLILHTSELAEKLFRHGESAFLLPKPDATLITRHLRAFLNDNTARVQMANHAYESVSLRVEQNYGAHLEAMRSSLERGLAA